MLTRARGRHSPGPRGRAADGGTAGAAAEAADELPGGLWIPVMRVHLPASEHDVMDPAPALYTIRINGPRRAMVGPGASTGRPGASAGGAPRLLVWHGE